MTNRRLKPTALFGAGILFFIVIIELILKLLPVDTNLRMQEADKQHFMLGEPNKDYIYSFGWLFKNAHHGITNNIGVPNSKNWGTHKPTILVVGDSYIESLMINYDDSLQGQLEKKLAGYQLLSLAHSGANAADYLQMASFARAQLDLKRLVMTIASNDFLDSSPSIEHTELGHNWFNYDDGLISLGFKNYSPSSSKLKALGRQFSLAYYLQRNLKFNPLTGIKNELSKTGKATAERSSDKMKSIGESELKSVIDYFLRELPLRSGVPLSSTVFVIDCDRNSLYRKWLLPSLSVSNPDHILDIFAHNAKEYGAVVVDMCPAMEAYVKEAKQRLDFSPEDSHWNPKGHELVANAVAAELAKIY